MTLSFFKNKTHIYEKYRPNYPNYINEFLNEKHFFKKNSIVAEFGCGTGKLTKILLENDNTIYGIESDIEMFNFVKNRFDKFANFEAYNSSAEKSNLPDNSIDVIIAGQAFHLFDIEKTKKEFYRVLKPNGAIVLLWYFLDMDYAISDEIRSFFYKYRDILNQPTRNKIDQKSLSDSFYPFKVDFNTLGRFKQRFTQKDFIQSMLSSSYAPSERDSLYNEYIEEAKKIFLKYSKDDTIEYLFKIDSYCLSNILSYE